MENLPFFRIVGTGALALAALAAAAQSRPPTTEQLGKDPGALRQEAEQQRSREMQQQQQNSQQQADQQWNDTLRQQQSRAAADSAQGEAVRRTWQQRPPLAPEKNPLLGRWESLGSGQRKAMAGVSPEMANLANALLGGVTAGMCDSMLGRGTIEFRPAGVLAIGRDGSERTMYRAEYRGGGSRVVVLPQGGTSFTHMIIDFDSADHATVAAVGCGLARSGASASKAAVATTAVAAADAGATPQWTLLRTVAGNGGIDVYVAPGSIRRSGDRARMLSLFDFKTRQVFEGKSYQSTRNEYEFDCAGSRLRIVETTGYTGHMGKGPAMLSSHGDGTWEPAGSSGPGHEHWTAACKRR